MTQNKNDSKNLMPQYGCVVDNNCFVFPTSRFLY